MRIYRAKMSQRNRTKLLEEAAKNYVSYKLRIAETVEEKHRLIADSNPLLHIFGQTLPPLKPYESYADWVNNATGEPNAEPEHITSVEEAREYLRKFRQEMEHGEA